MNESINYEKTKDFRLIFSSLEKCLCPPTLKKLSSRPEIMCWTYDTFEN